jgi:hypothetical protein
MRLFAIAILTAGPVMGLAGCGDNNSTAPNSETVLESVSPAAGATRVDPLTPIMNRFQRTDGEWHGAVRGPPPRGHRRAGGYHDLHLLRRPDHADLCSRRAASDASHYTIHMGPG